jgi:hypothetical protein
LTKKSFQKSKVRMTNKNMKVVYARTPGGFRTAVRFAILMYLVAILLVFFGWNVTSAIVLVTGTAALTVSGILSYQAYRRDKHRDYRCSKCNGLLRHRHVAWTDDKMSKIDGMDYYCYRCKESVPKIELPFGVYSAVQDDRRKLSFSKTKDLLRAAQLEEPVRVEDNRWLVYELPDRGRIYYDSREQVYDYVDINDKTTRVHEFAEMIKILG